MDLKSDVQHIGIFCGLLTNGEDLLIIQYLLLASIYLMYPTLVVHYARNKRIDSLFSPTKNGETLKFILNSLD